jgi:predicted ester cyclase
MLAGDVAIHGLGGEAIRGREGYRPFFDGMHNTFSQIEVVVEDAVEQGNTIAARCTVRGTHTGDGIGFAPTGRRVELLGMTVVKVKDGKMVEGWNNFDFAGMLQQIGADRTGA